MNKQAKVTIAALAAAVIGLGTALGVVAMRGDGHDATSSTMMSRGQPANASMGMLQAMGRLDSAAMLQQMRSVLGDQAYEQMLQHFQQHRSGTPAAGMPGIDAMMHEMMDGMLQQMPMDAGNMMPGPGTPWPGASPTP